MTTKIVPTTITGTFLDEGTLLTVAECCPDYSFIVDGLTFTLDPRVHLTAHQLYRIIEWKEWLSLNRHVTPERMMEQACDTGIFQHFKSS